jgi:hypothetical protein
MSLSDLLKTPSLQKAATTFAAGYARRMLEGQYTRLFETDLGKRATKLSRPSKYAVEAVLNGIVAYLSTKEDTLANTPVKAFLWEVAKDAPSEISKRLLNGDHKTPASPLHGFETSDPDKQTVLDGLLRMDASNLGTFLSWLEKASPEDRRQMAETMSRLTEEEQKKLLALTPEQARVLFASGSDSGQAESPQKEGMVTSMTSALRGLNERLEQRKRSSPL